MERSSTSGILAFKAVFNGSRACGLQPITDKDPSDDTTLRIHVVFTSTAETLYALKSAAALTIGCSAQIALLVPLIVPYPLRLEEPPVSLGFACRRITDLVSSIPETELEAYIYLCRDSVQTMLQVLRPHSLVLIGTHRRWFFSRSRRIAWKLRAQGHDVVLADKS